MYGARARRLSLRQAAILPRRPDAFVKRRQVGAMAGHAGQSLVFYVGVESLKIAVHREDRNALFHEPADDVTADARRCTCDVSSLALESELHRSPPPNLRVARAVASCRRPLRPVGEGRGGERFARLLKAGREGEAANPVGTRPQ